jgi:hypothetical protein
MIDFSKPLLLLVCSEGVKHNFENDRHRDKYILGWQQMNSQFIRDQGTSEQIKCSA